VHIECLLGGGHEQDLKTLKGKGSLAALEHNGLLFYDKDLHRSLAATEFLTHIGYRETSSLELFGYDPSIDSLDP
jgi:hypothetical protein